MNRTALPTIPIPVQTPDFPDVAALHQDFPATNELHVLDGRPSLVGVRNRRRGLRALGWATLGSLSTAIVVVATHPLGQLLHDLSVGAR